MVIKKIEITNEWEKGAIRKDFQDLKRRKIHPQGQRNMKGWGMGSHSSCRGTRYSELIKTDQDRWSGRVYNCCQGHGSGLESSQDPFLTGLQRKTTTAEDFFDLMDFRISQIRVWTLTVCVTSNKWYNFLTLYFSNYRKTIIIPFRSTVKNKWNWWLEGVSLMHGRQ